MYTLLCSQYIFFHNGGCSNQNMVYLELCLIIDHWEIHISMCTRLDHVPDIWFKHHWAGAGCCWVIQTTSRVSKRGWTKAAFSYWEIICWGIFISNDFLLAAIVQSRSQTPSNILGDDPLPLLVRRSWWNRRYRNSYCDPWTCRWSWWWWWPWWGVHQVVMVGVRMVFRSRARGRASTSQFQSQNQSQKRLGFQRQRPHSRKPVPFPGWFTCCLHI